MASFRDLGAGKLDAVCDRFEVRDFVDVHAIAVRRDEHGEPPADEVRRAHARGLVLDLMRVDPGLDPARIGQALARGLDRPIIGGFPLRLLMKIEERDVQETLHLAVETCAALARGRMGT